MSQGVFIIHGSYGYPEENWFPWLKKELEKSGCKVYIPKFPTPENQSLDFWLNVFDNYKKYLDENTILIGHSLGVAFILRILEKLEKPVKASFFVVGFIGLLNIDKFDKVNKTFIDKDFKWDKIMEKSKEFFIYNSDNDPYVPLSKGEEIAKNLDAKLTIVHNAGHFNAKPSYNKFEMLLEDIELLLYT